MSRLCAQLCVALICLFLQIAQPSFAHSFAPLGPYRRATQKAAGLTDQRDLVSRCTEKRHNTTLDHYGWTQHEEGGPIPPTRTYSQRYFVCSEHWKPGGPIFFYLGNEADVLLYLNASGLMWETAPEMSAMLVFAEHRYYGKSKPFPAETLRSNMQYLSAQQALADYAELITSLKCDLNASDSAVIGFGGSYGGMLAAWGRMKFPHIFDGAIAGSAPIWTFLGEDPPYDDKSFAKIVTQDASLEGGSAEACAPNMREGWQTLFRKGGSKAGREEVSEAMLLCPHAKLESEDDVQLLAQWLQSAWDYLAMGDFPYASTYLLNGMGELPAYPVVKACEALAEEHLEGSALLAAMAKGAGVFYNYTHDMPCFDYKAGANKETDEDSDFWGYQSCTEQWMPMSRDGVSDMFWSQPFDSEAMAQWCWDTWKVVPRPMWPEINWGGRHIQTASNIVFSNGKLDPWSSGGVLEDINESVVAVVIEHGAHHVDLMFSNPPCFQPFPGNIKLLHTEEDPESFKQARATERHHIRKWVKEVAQRNASRRRTQGSRASHWVASAQGLTAQL